MCYVDVTGKIPKKRRSKQIMTHWHFTSCWVWDHPAPIHTHLGRLTRLFLFSLPFYLFVLTVHFAQCISPNTVTVTVLPSCTLCYEHILHRTIINNDILFIPHGVILFLPAPPCAPWHTFWWERAWQWRAVTCSGAYVVGG